MQSKIEIILNNINQHHQKDRDIKIPLGFQFELSLRFFSPPHFALALIHRP